MSSPAELSQIATAAKHLNAAKYYDIASFVMLLYDALLTFPREVDKIWKMKWTGVTFFWFLNRWLFILAVVPTIVAFHDSGFTGEACHKYYRYAGYIATFQRVVIGSVFTLRTYCIYGRNVYAAGLVAVFFIIEVILKLCAVTIWGTEVVLPKGFVACVLATSLENANKFMINWGSELCTDTVVLVLTMYRSYVVFKTSVVFRQSGLWHIIVKDGIMYFFIMFAANLTTVIFDLTAAQDLKAINANFGVMINCIMTARLILNLKSAVANRDVDDVRYPGFNGAQSNFEATILGNIGNNFEDISYGLSSTSTLTPMEEFDKPGKTTHNSTVHRDEYELSVRSARYQAELS